MDSRLEAASGLITKEWQEMIKRRKESVLVPSAKDEDRNAACLTCNDMHWVYKNAPFGHPDFGKAFPCPHCDDDKTSRMLKYSGIPNARREMNFTCWKSAFGADEAMNMAYALAKGETNYKLLLIHGDYGCGKTHIAFASCLHIIRDRGIKAKFWRITQLLEEMRRGINGESPISADELLAECKAVPFLALDDMGVEMGTDWQRQQVEEIILHRYEEEMPTVATTNDLNRITPRLRSKFTDAQRSRTVHNRAWDFRRRA